MLELVDPVGRVDVDQDEPGERRAELGEHPFAAIGRPDSDAVALFQAERLKPDREVLRAPEKLGVGPAHILVAGHEGEPVRTLGDDAAQQRPDSLAEEGRRTDAVDIGLREFGHGVRSLIAARL